MIKHKFLIQMDKNINVGFWEIIHHKSELV